MDNILKLLLGVLSVAGLIAMVTPTNLTVAPPVPIAADDIPAVEGPAQISDPALLPEEETVEEAEDDPFSTGEPMIDGNPINGQSVANNSESDSPQQSPPAFDPATYGIPNMAAYSPPPVYNVPDAIDANGQVLPAQ